MGAVLVVGWLSLQAVLRPRTVQSFEQTSAASSPCDAARQFPQEISPYVLARLKVRYGLTCR
jgi:hypothetical protein